ncbi:hypothetical protein D3C85_765390 [compost metagenome]
MKDTKMYICVLDEFPDYMVPTLVAHSVLAAHFTFSDNSDVYNYWLKDSFKKVVCRVNQKEFEKIRSTLNCHVGFEKHTLEGKDSCLVVEPVEYDKIPNVLKFAKTWKPKEIAV